MGRPEEHFEWLTQSNRDLREQLGSAMDTAKKISDRMARLRGLLEFYVDQGVGMTPEQVKEIYAELDKMLRGRVRTMISSLIMEAPQTPLDTPL